MPGNSAPSHCNGANEINLTATWLPGERTIAWNNLWRRILADVARQISGDVYLAPQEAQGNE